MQREIVDARRQVDVIRVRFPLHRKAEQIHVELLHRLEMSDVEREMTEADVRGTIHECLNPSAGRCESPLQRAMLPPRQLATRHGCDCGGLCLDNVNCKL